MKVTLKGNTAKTKKFTPATETQPARLYFGVADKINRREGGTDTVWYNVVCSRKYAETVYRLLHGDKEISRFVQIDGEIINAPKVRTKNNQIETSVTIWANEVTFLDNKWPENDVPADVMEEEAPVGFDEETPWD